MHRSDYDSDNARAGRDTQLDHDHPDECPHGIGADGHSHSDLFVGEPLNQELDDRPLPFRQAVTLAYFGNNVYCRAASFLELLTPTAQFDAHPSESSQGNVRETYFLLPDIILTRESMPKRSSAW